MTIGTVIAYASDLPSKEAAMSAVSKYDSVDEHYCPACDRITEWVWNVDELQCFNHSGAFSGER
ncbi:hypothetical protein [Nocardia sp. NPDC047648]|uniref:hypothetical protein n=1 Tax=Nocardia sp. NPDC047648 TaxID=3155625 RepID=UPI0033D756F5